MATTPATTDQTPTPTDLPDAALDISGDEDTIAALLGALAVHASPPMALAYLHEHLVQRQVAAEADTGPTGSVDEWTSAHSAGEAHAYEAAARYVRALRDALAVSGGAR